MVENAKPAFVQITEGLLTEALGQLSPLWSGLAEWLSLIARELVRVDVLTIDRVVMALFYRNKIYRTKLKLYQPLAQPLQILDAGASSLT